MSEITLKYILEELSKVEFLDSREFALKHDTEHQVIVGLLMKLDSVPGYVTLKQTNVEVLELTAEGKELAENGSYEYRFYRSLTDDGLLHSSIKNNQQLNLGFSKSMANGWVRLEKDHPNGPTVFKKVATVEDNTQKILKIILNDPQTKQFDGKVFSDLRKSRLVSKNTVKKFLVYKDSKFDIKLPEIETDLTADLLINNNWKQKTFKSYNFNTNGVDVSSGALHPLLKMRSEFSELFINLGFEEMRTDNFVESSFWNFDSLFQPQQHSAREAHDTFFLIEPKFSDLSDVHPDYLERVKAVHENGSGCDSIGFKTKWDVLEARKLILRTHTTAVSARYLYKLAQNKPFKPVKYFSIDRVFRNETTDSTHLAEFHQVEGLIADYDLSLGHLISILNDFFRQLGITKLRFKPAYNPYTEPSMEVFSYHAGLKKWVEIGNSGIFRPEMLIPMGLPEGVSVIAWGLSLERPTMIKYGINNIRTLLGHKIDINLVRNSQICLV